MITFEELGLGNGILRAVEELGFEKPTPIQEKVIPAILNDETDLIAQAQTGTGKTAAFGFPLIQMTDLKSNRVQAFVLCPTRELCVQITTDLGKYSKFTSNFRVVAVYGGASITTQISDLKRGAHIVVGTPGRVLDLIRRKVLKISSIRWLVLDEADEMLNMGFKEELDTILAETPEVKQTLLFSATMPQEIIRIANKYMHKPIELVAGKRNIGAENVRHEYYIVHARNRYEALKRVADINPRIYGIVFCRTRQETKDVADKLIKDGYNADALHGDLSQSQRDHVMNRFRTKHLQILVATDVAARGLDVDDLTHVINYNLPDDPEVYIHRSGRTGRAGKSGVAITIIHTRETRRMRDIEKLVGKRIEQKQVPGGREICEKQLYNLVDKVEKTEVDDHQIDQYLDVIYKKLNWLSREELIKQFVSVEFNRFLDYYKNAPDLNVDLHEKKTKRSFKEKEQIQKKKRTGINYSRFYINLGSSDNLNPTKLIGLILDNTKDRSIGIGKIDIMKKFSFFEIETSFTQEIIKGFTNAKFNGKPALVELSKPDPKFKTNKSFQERTSKRSGEKGDKRKKRKRIN